jgi:SAM-dependent methyltransferase
MASEPRPCILCGRPEPFEPFFEAGGCVMVRCPDCGLVFQHPQPSAEVLDQTSFCSPQFADELMGPLRELTLTRARERLEALQPLIAGRSGATLDVGCSSGAWLEVIEAEGWTGSGVELSENVAATARDRGLDVHAGSLSDAMPKLKDSRFDLITFWDVLEHVRDPRVELEQALELLADDGLIAATLPNLGGWYPRTTYRLFAKRIGVWEYPELPVHLYDFDKTTLARLLKGSGLEVAASKTWNAPFSYYRQTTLSPQAVGGRKGPLIRGAFGLLHRLIYPLARLTDHGNTQFAAARRA